MSQLPPQWVGQPPDADGWVGPALIRENLRTGKTSALYVRGDESQWRDTNGKIIKLS